MMYNFFTMLWIFYENKFYHKNVPVATTYPALGLLNWPDLEVFSLIYKIRKSELFFSWLEGNWKPQPLARKRTLNHLAICPND